MSQIITPNSGLTPQGQAVASAQPNSVNTMPPPGSPSSAYPSDQDLNSKYATANASAMTANSSDTRQGLVSNSNIPQMQNNYDDLAKQLFEYDQGTLAPKFQGTNPGLPSDAASFGRVDASPLAMTVSSAGLPASQGLSTATNNPKYAYSSQMDQSNSILSLLSTLIGGINSGMTDVKGKNASNVLQANAAIEHVLKLMTLKQTALASEKASLGGLAGENQSAAEARLLADAQKGVTFTDLVKRYTADGLSPSQIRSIYNNVNYYGKAAGESDDDVNAIIAGQKPSAQAAKDKANKAKSDALNVTKTTIQGLLDQYNGLGMKGNPVYGTLGTVNPMSKESTYEQQRRSLVAALKDVAGAGAGSGVRVTNAELKIWSDLLPSTSDTAAQAKTKLNTLNTQLIAKFGTGLDSSYTGGDKIHITDGKQVLEYDKNDPEAQKALKNGWRVK